MSGQSIYSKSTGVNPTPLVQALEARLLRKTAVLADVATGDELERMQAEVVQAPTNDGLTNVNVQASVHPIEVSQSDMLMAVTESRTETHAAAASSPTSDTFFASPRLVRFRELDGRWLAVASEPIESDQSGDDVSVRCG